MDPPWTAKPSDIPEVWCIEDSSGEIVVGLVVREGFEIHLSLGQSWAVWAEAVSVEWVDERMRLLGIQSEACEYS